MIKSVISRLIFTSIAICGSLLLGCSSTEPEVVEPPIPEPEPEVVLVTKPKILWIDASANVTRLRYKRNITDYLELSKQMGFNEVVVDVKPVQGHVLYDSDFLPHISNLGGVEIGDRGFDYLQYFIEECRRLELKITVSTTIMTMGNPTSGRGPAYDDPQWEGKTCIEYLPTDQGDATYDPTIYKMQDIKFSNDWGVFAFLNPIYPEVKEYVLAMVEELITKYDFDGYILDYCRYNNINSDFSQASKTAFEHYAGVSVDNFPLDIFAYNINDKTNFKPGPHYNKWLEWRTSVITGYVRDISSLIKRLDPEIEFSYWAASWWPLPDKGQNWSSSSTTSTTISSGNLWWATPEFYNLGFADQLHNFQLGAYMPTVYGANDPNSVEYNIIKGKKLINGDCLMYGTIDCSNASFDIKSAVELCLLQSDGVMVFDMSHVDRNKKWDLIKEGIDNAEKILSEQASASN